MRLNKYKGFRTKNTVKRGLDLEYTNRKIKKRDYCLICATHRCQVTFERHPPRGKKSLKKCGGCCTNKDPKSIRKNPLCSNLDSGITLLEEEESLLDDYDDNTIDATDS